MDHPLIYLWYCRLATYDTGAWVAQKCLLSVSVFNSLGQVSSTSPLPLVLPALLLLCSDSDLTESLRPREYLSNVKLSGLVVDVASVASAAPFSSEAPIDGRG